MLFPWPQSWPFEILSFCDLWWSHRYFPMISLSPWVHRSIFSRSGLPHDHLMQPFIPSQFEGFLEWGTPRTIAFKANMASFRMGFWGYPHVRPPPNWSSKRQVFRSRLPVAECLRLPPCCARLPRSLCRHRGGGLRAVPVGRSYGARAQPQQLWWTQVGYGQWEISRIQLMEVR
jgi:hypothetical protein